MPRFNLEDYVDVAERIRRFYKQYPEGRIITRLESLPDDFTQCRFKAEVFRDSAEGRSPDATGWAFEIAGSGGANQTSHGENCETSAIGRALANLGFVTTSEQRASRQEMEKVQRLSPPDNGTAPTGRLSALRNA
jgi:hypothetical protein